MLAGFGFERQAAMCRRASAARCRRASTARYPLAVADGYPLATAARCRRGKPTDR
jgi:hypothetical protein